MYVDRFIQLLRQRPFQPFRVYLKDGRVFDVRYPEMNMVCTTFVTIGIPEANVSDPFPEHLVDVEYSLIRQIEPASVTAAPSK